MPTKNTGTPHVFGRPRPSATGKFQLHQKTKRDTHFRPLPNPTGHEPYQLDLKSILPARDYDTIVKKKKLTIHLNVDMGGIQYAVPHKLVAKGMEADFNARVDASENA